jgi:hypothetical protein
MPLKVWNGSSWQVVAQLKVWNGSSWVSTNALDNAKTAKVWNGSSWVQFHPGVRLDEYGFVADYIDLTAFDSVNNGGTAEARATITLNSNGTATYSIASTGGGTTTLLTYSWLLTGANSDYYAYMDTPTGSFTSGTTGTALQLNTTYAWEKSISNSVNNSIVDASVSSTLRLRNSLGTDILAIDLSMFVEAQVGIPP